MKAVKILVCVSFTWCIPSHATIFVQGNGTSPATFTQAVNTKVFDSATGTLYVGLLDGASNGYNISKVTRPVATSVSTPVFTPIATNSIFGTNGIDSLALATSQGNTNPFLVGIFSAAVYELPATLFAMNNTGTTIIQPSAASLLDAAGAATNGIVTLTASSNYVFAAVEPNGSSSFFGEPNSGIALVRIDTTTTSGVTVPSQLIQTAAVPGNPSILAQRFDATTTQLNPGTGTPTITNNAITLYWDEPLQILYMGTTITTGAAGGDGARSVVVGSQQNGALNLLNIAPNGAFTAGNTTNIVGVITTVGSETLTVHKLAVMHTSTGPSYLIVNGGNGSNTGDMIFALPLVDNPSSPSTNGTLANKNSLLSVKNADLGTVAFTVAAAANADLPTSSDLAALVGGGPFPIPATSTVADMVVIDDAVYVASAIPQSTNNEVGIFYSQAMFDNTGKIVRWTPWARRMFPIHGITGTSNNGVINFFAVDAVSGNIWGIGGDNAQTVVLTQWDHGTSPGLVAQLNKTLPNGCYSSLDLNQATSSLGTNTPSRYALFGSASQVAFALTSFSLAAAAPFNVSGGIPAPQSVTTDFTQPQNFLLTTLPGNAGTVTSLEFSRSTSNNQNYFFAGTPNGLYVYSDSGGNGFTISPTTFGNLNATTNPSIATGIWQKAPTISGSVIDVTTSGLSLYVLTFQTTKTTPYLSTLYNIPFQSTVAAMFAPSNISIIAQSSTNPVFSSTLFFSGMQIIKTGAPTNTTTIAQKEQLVLSTNTGLYVSQADQTVGNGIVSATNQTAAQWTQQNSIMYDAVAGMDTPLPATVWPISTVDQFGFNTFDRSSVYQVSGTGTSAGTSSNFTASPGIPSMFNGSSTTTQFETLQPVTYFYSDGARRLFVANAPVNTPATTGILSFSWDVQNWNVSDPATTQFFYPALSGNNGFFWIQEIGATGIVIAGTQQGVVGLE
ncbi:MAG: beta strand repeat-containing protein [Candidatus Babeliales bacterium]